MLSDKINMLQSNIKSLSDLIEILTGCFFKGEFEQIFKLLNDIERAELWKTISEEQEVSYNSFYNEEQWQQEFIKYVDSLDIQRQKFIKPYELG